MHREGNVRNAVHKMELATSICLVHFIETLTYPWNFAGIGGFIGMHFFIELVISDIDACELGNVIGRPLP